MLWHVTGTYHWTDTVLGKPNEHTVIFDTLIEATDEDAAINQAICREIVEMPEYENEDDMLADPATDAQIEAYAQAQAAQYQAQHSEPLFPLE